MKVTLNDVTKTGLFCDGDWIEKKDQDPNGTVRLIQLADIGDGVFKDKSSRFITENTAQELNCTYLESDDILVARLPEPLGRACLFPLRGKYITAVDVAIIRIANPDINNKYIMYMINSPAFRQNIKSFESGTTRKRISRKNLSKIEFELPPLPEQERIVARIEELFSDLDKAVETLNTTKQQLAVYRQAVISTSFPELTSSNSVRLDEIAEISGGITKGRDLSQQKTITLPYLRVANVQNGYLDLSQMKDVEVKLNEVDKYLLQEGDVLYTEGGDRDKLGRGTVWKNEIPRCVHQNHVFKARLNQERALPQYVAYWSMSVYARDYFFKKGKQSVNLASINKTVLSALILPMPSLEEQASIINNIESRLSVCDQIEKTIEQSLQQAEALRQSILKQAFEGRL